MPADPGSDQTGLAPQDDTLNAEELDLQKEKVLSVLNKAVEELSSSIQMTVAIKLKTLEDDWNKSDDEVKILLLELSQCVLCNFSCSNVFYCNFFSFISSRSKRLEKCISSSAEDCHERLQWSMVARCTADHHEFRKTRGSG